MISSIPVLEAMMVLYAILNFKVGSLVVEILSNQVGIGQFIQYRSISFSLIHTLADTRHQIFLIHFSGRKDPISAKLFWKMNVQHRTDWTSNVQRWTSNNDVAPLRNLISFVFKNPMANLEWLFLFLFSPPGRRPYPPACKSYGLEAGPEAVLILVTKIL